MPDSSGAFDLSSLPKEQQEALNDLAEKADAEGYDPGPAPRERVQTAFIVVTALDGSVGVAGLDQADQFDPVQPTPNNDQIFAATQVVGKDIQTAEIAQNTVQLQMMQARVMQQEMESKAIAAKLRLSGNEGGRR